MAWIDHEDQNKTQLVMDQKRDKETIALDLSQGSDDESNGSKLTISEVLVELITSFPRSP